MLFLYPMPKAPILSLKVMKAFLCPYSSFWCCYLFSTLSTTIRNEELRHDAQTDGLTGVLNKRTTEALINEILEQRPHEKGTFIILDVDKFKEVNDHYGHAVGDIVLSTLGQTLRNYFRENDIIGRIGGDEFVIYMCKTERQRWIFSFPKAG